MAARRLLIVMGILFAISIAAAAIAPQRRTTTSTETSTSTTTEAAPAQSSGGEVNARLLASASSPRTIRAAVGDQLNLSVAANEPIEVEITPFGLIGNAAPAAPALFNVLLNSAGAVAITDADNGQVIGRLLVRPAGSGLAK